MLNIIRLDLLLLFYSFESFSYQRYLMVFHWGLSDSKSPQVSSTLLSLLAVLNNAADWMVSSRLVISKSSSPFINPLVSPSLSCSIVFFLSPLARSRYLSLFSLSLRFSMCSAGRAQSSIRQVLIYYYYYSLIRAFHISVSRWFFTGAWVTASLLKSPGLFLVFWSFSIMLSFGWSPPVCQIPSPPVPLVII